MLCKLVPCLLLVGVLLSGSRANVELNTCQTDGYCAGVNISYTCSADTESIQILLINTDDTPVLDVWFNESSTIGDTQSQSVGSVNVWYNKTSDTSVRVWFVADPSLHEFTFECRDVENESDIESLDCQIGINNAPVNPIEFGIDEDNSMYCEVANFTWGINGNDTCLTDFVLRVKPSNNNSYDVIVPSYTRSYTGLIEPEIGSVEHCVSIAPKNYLTTGPFSDPPQCVTFDVPETPRMLRPVFNVNDKNDEDEITVTIQWRLPSVSRPYVMYYYITSNLTDNDDGSSGSGENENEDRNEFQTRKISGGDRTMMMLEGGKEGYWYEVRLIAENCYGNSTETARLVFRLVAPPTTTTTTPMPSTTSPSPSASPTVDDDDDDSFPTFIIIIIAVVGGLLLAAVLIGVIVCICCCCVCGTTAVCCAAASSSSNKPYDMEMSGKGTRL